MIKAKIFMDKQLVCNWINNKPKDVKIFTITEWGGRYTVFYTLRK